MLLYRNGDPEVLSLILLYYSCIYIYIVYVYESGKNVDFSRIIAYSLYKLGVCVVNPI